MRQVQSWVADENGNDYSAPPRMLWVLIDELDNLLEQAHAQAIKLEEDGWQQVRPSS